MHSPVDGLLGCFHVSAIISNAAVYVGVQTSLQHSDFISFRYIRRKDAGSQHGSPTFNF